VAEEIIIIGENGMKNILIISLLASLAFSQNVFISEYSEGSSNNKYIEIFNGTGANVDLSSYELWKIANGGEWAEYTLSLSAIVPTGDVYVICSSSANLDPLIDAECDETWTQANFTGNDALALVYNNNIIDQIGEDGDDPGNGWDVAGITEATKDHTLVRKMSVTAGNINWASSASTNGEDSEWVVFDQNTWDYVGAHGDLPDIEGCMDESADNYNPNATISCNPDCCEYIEYTEMTIAAARALGIDAPVIVQGIVTSPNFGTTHGEYTIQDATAGIILYGYGLEGLEVEIGTEIRVQGETAEFAGKFEIIASLSDVEIIGAGTIPDVQIINVNELLINGEAYESELITIENVQPIDGADPWPAEGSSASIDITDDNGVSITIMRIDSDFEIDGMPEPNWPLNLTGVGGQWNDDYQILPRLIDDFNGDGGCSAAIGDLNCDGDWNVLDIVALANCVLADSCDDAADAGDAADVNLDGGWNVLDVVILANCVLADSCGGTLGRVGVDDANHSKLIINDNIVSIEADGFIGGVQMTLTHGDDFSIEMTDWALFADYLTTGNETRLLVITPETEELFRYSGDFEISEIIVANSQNEIPTSLPAVYSLSSAYPNPFNPVTTMTLTIPKSGNVNVQIYNLYGQIVTTLLSGNNPANTYSLVWDASNSPSGMYCVKAEFGGITETHKLMLIK